MDSKTRTQVARALRAAAASLSADAGQIGIAEIDVSDLSSTRAAIAVSTNFGLIGLVTWDDKRGELEIVKVDRHVRRQGIGSALIRAAERFHGGPLSDTGERSKEGDLLLKKLGKKPAKLKRRIPEREARGLGGLMMSRLLMENQTGALADRVLSKWDKISGSAASDEAKWYKALHRRQKGIFYRGVPPSGKGSDIGALGAGLYVTWNRGVAQFFAKGGDVIEYELPVGLKLLDSKSGFMADIKAKMGIKPWEYIEGKMFANLVASDVKRAGYDGVISDNPAEGLVIFDKRKVQRVSGSVLSASTSPGISE